MRRFPPALHLWIFLLAPLVGHAAGLTTLYTIKGIVDGATPYAGVLVNGNTIYGTTYAGGAAALGSIWERDQTTGKVTVLYSFAGGANGAHPEARLVRIGNKLYGTTPTGASFAYKLGTVFSFDLATKTLTTIQSGYLPIGDLIVVGGKIYGAANFCAPPNGKNLFSIDPATNAYSVVYAFSVDAFSGPTPQSGPVEAGGALYGTLYNPTTNRGSIYRVDIATGKETVLWTFGSDAAIPVGNVAVVGSMLYGTTEGDGANRDGTVFSINLATGAESTVYSFTGGTDGVSPSYGLVAVNGILYGVTQGYAFAGVEGGQTVNLGTLFSVDPATGIETTLHSFAGKLDGASPSAGMSVVNGVLYGTTSAGGAFGAGTVFYYRPAIRYFGVLNNFAGLSGAAVPALTDEGGELYGVAPDGGPSGAGLAFKVSIAHGNGRGLLDFQGGAGGAYPAATLLRVNGMLFGTTTYGGAAGAGTIYSVDPVSGKETVVAEFAGGAEGQFPGNLVAAGGMIYGTTGLLNEAVAGTVFRLNPTTGSISTLATFTGIQGHFANANIGTPNSLVALGTKLYGTTANGGDLGIGSIFSIDMASGTVTLLHTFEAFDGSGPKAAMISLNGTLYGTTSGSVGGGGTLFSLDPATDTLTTLYTFGETYSTDGMTPEGPLLNVGGMLYGTTSIGGTLQGGTVFQFDPASSSMTWLYNFSNAVEYGATPEGYGPASGLVDIGGTLYGTTSVGGAGNAGAVFQLTP